MKISRLFLALLLVCVCFVMGCSNRVTVTGHVTFKEDGTPLTIGTVVYESKNYQGFGTLDKNGYYSLGEARPGDKIQPGEYKIKILASTGGDSSGAPLVNHVHPKYADTGTSGLTQTVKGKTVRDITVEKP